MCNSCYHSLNSKKENRAPSPPANFKKRLESAKVTEQEMKEITATSDLESRLYNLKFPNPGTVPTEQEIGERLAVLKNLPAKYYTATHTVIYKAPDTRTEAQQADGLINQYQKEAELDSRRLKPEDEIEERLKRLRVDWPLNDEKSSHRDINPTGQATSLSNNEKIDDPESEDEDTSVKKLMEKFLAEAALANQEEENMEISPIEGNEVKEEEFPFCIICNDDARLRCPQCSNDLYCKPCFKEFHEDEDDHKPVPYKPKIA